MDIIVDEGPQIIPVLVPLAAIMFMCWGLICAAHAARRNRVRAVVLAICAAALVGLGTLVFGLSGVANYAEPGVQYVAAVHDRYGVNLDDQALGELGFPLHELDDEPRKLGETETVTAVNGHVVIETIALVYTGEHLILCTPLPDGTCDELPLA